MFSGDEITTIRKSIIDGVNAAKNSGIDVDYPESFTAESENNGKKITVKYPLFDSSRPLEVDAPPLRNG
ncbi:hypothetical protein [Dasania marina]|uniref:hypothetical protein n=1 Tax=Dasania marina TaxID=471499 RepID=UPI0003672E89|nr:hypothetical protein [Dasania marina]